MVDPDKLETLHLFDLTTAAGTIRSFGKTTKTVEDLADLTVRCLYDDLKTEPNNERASVLVRFFRTVSYCNLEARLKKQVVRSSGELESDEKCLVLLGTAGDVDAWNSRHTSTTHQVIPLLSPEMVAQSPMISRLFTELGIEISSLFRAEKHATPAVIVPSEQDYKIFFVPEANESPYIPAKDQFVKPHGVRSVIGYGASLPSGDLFAVVIFFRIHLTSEEAQKFTSLTLSTIIATLQLPPEKIFSPHK